MVSSRVQSRIRFASLAVAVVWTGCGVAGSHGRDSARGIPAGQTVPVRVTNQNLSDVNIYALARGQTMWLGLATSKQTRTFQLPSRFVSYGPIQLRVAPVGGGGGQFDSDLVLVGPDEAIDLTVADLNLADSVLSVGPATSDTTSH